MKKILFAIALAALSLPVLSSAATIVFDSVTGFSGTQGENGWSYAYVTSTDVGDIRANQVEMTYYSDESLWKGGDTGVPGAVQVSADEQRYFAGGTTAYAIRYWTADQDYESVTFTTTFVADTYGVNSTIYYSTSTTQVTLTNKVVTTVSGTEYSLDSTDVADMTIEGTTIVSAGTIYNVSAGDRIYFVSRNSGVNQGSALQPWSMEITAVIPESSSSALLIGGLVLGLIFCCRRRS